MSNLTSRAFTLGVALFAIHLVQGCARSTNSENMNNQGGTTQTFADPQTAASQSLATFKKLVTKDNYKELGFDSPDEVSTSTLGSPMRVFMVKVEQLRDYQTEKDANALLSESGQMYFPVTVNGEARSSVVVEQAEGKWRSASFGNAGLAKQIASVTKTNQTAETAARPADMIVQVPALGVYFLGGRNADNRLVLTPIAANATFGLQAGSTEPAEVIFARLAPFARNYNGLPM